MPINLDFKLRMSKLSGGRIIRDWPEAGEEAQQHPSTRGFSCRCGRSGCILSRSITTGKWNWQLQSHGSFLKFLIARLEVKASSSLSRMLC